LREGRGDAATENESTTVTSSQQNRSGDRWRRWSQGVTRDLKKGKYQASQLRPGFLEQPERAHCVAWRISEHFRDFQHRYRFSTISITASQGLIMGSYNGYLKVYFNRYRNRNERAMPGKITRIMVCSLLRPPPIKVGG